MTYIFSYLPHHVSLVSLYIVSPVGGECVFMYVRTCGCVCVYVYVYWKRERDRESAC